MSYKGSITSASGLSSEPMLPVIVQGLRSLYLDCAYGRRYADLKAYVVYDIEAVISYFSDLTQITIHQALLDGRNKFFFREVNITVDRKGLKAEINEIWKGASVAVNGYEKQCLQLSSSAAQLD